MLVISPLNNWTWLSHDLTRRSRGKRDFFIQFTDEPVSIRPVAENFRFFSPFKIVIDALHIGIFEEKLFTFDIYSIGCSVSFLAC